MPPKAQTTTTATIAARRTQLWVCPISAMWAAASW
jgi:hypothetical protein